MMRQFAHAIEWSAQRRQLNLSLSAATIADDGIRLDKGPSRLGNMSSLLVALQ